MNDLKRKLAVEYGMDASLEKIEGSHCNTLYDVRAKRRYLLKVLNKRYSSKHIESERRLVEHMRKNGLNAPEIILTKEDNPSFSFEGKECMLYEMVEGKLSKRDGSADLVSIAALQAKTHALLKNYPQVNRIFMFNPKIQPSEFKERFIAIRKKIDGLDFRKLVKTVTPSVFVPDHILKNDRGLWILDTNEHHLIERVYDLANSLLSFSIDDRNLRLDVKAYTTYLKSYDEIYPLNFTEKSILKTCVEFILLESYIRDKGLIKSVKNGKRRLVKKILHQLDSMSSRLDQFRKIADRYKEYDVNRFMYPPTSVLEKFSFNEVKAMWKGSEEKLSMYVNIPFCVEKCRYCHHDSYPVEGQDVKGYLDYLYQQMEFFKESFRGKFDNLYIGGGTPTILDEDQMSELMQRLFACFEFKKGSKTFESNPFTTTLLKLKLIRKYGFNRVSFGVQSFDSVVLKTAKRGYQSFKSISNAIKNAKACGFDDINVDLILGLVHETRENFLDSFRKLLSLRPTSAVVYHLQCSGENIEYIKEQFKDGKEHADYLAKIKDEVESEVLSISKEMGYEASMPKKTDRAWSFKKKGSVVDKNKYSPNHPEPFSLFALGKFARSQIFRKAFFKDISDSWEFDPDKKAFEGFKLTSMYEMRRFVLNSIIRDSLISRADFSRNFNRKIEDVFRDELIELEELGQIRIGKSIHFLPVDAYERLLYSMYFVEPDYLESEDDRPRNEDCVFEKKKWISITGLCNNNCMFCLDGSRPDKSHKDIASLKEEISASKGNSKLIISGGEPTIHPDVVELVRFGKECGFSKIQVITNGRMFASQKFTDDMVEAGLNEVTFSIHGFDPAMHDGLTRVPGSFKQILRGVKNVRKHGLIINTDTCMTLSNYRQIPDIIRFIVEKVGIDEVNLMTMVPQGNAWKYKDKVMCDYEKMLPFVQKTMDYCLKRKVNLWLSRFPGRYLEGYEEFIEDPYKLVDEIRGRLENLKTLSPECRGDMCDFCSVYPICGDFIEALKGKRKDPANVIKIPVPALRLSEYSSPRLTELAAGLKKKDKKGIFVDGIPRCILMRNRIKNIRPTDLKDAVFTGDHLKLAEELARRVKIKKLSCRECMFDESCSGIYLNYARKYGFKEMNPVLKDIRHKEIRITMDCNQDCLFCNTDKDADDVVLGRKNILREIQKGNYNYLTITGREPTLDKDLFDYINLAKRLGIAKIEIQTNAICCTEDYVKRLMSSGLTHAFVSLHAADEKTSAKITQAPGTFEKTLQGIRNLKEIDVTVNVVVNSLNYKDLKKIAGLILSLGVYSIVFSVVAPVVKALENRDILPKYEKIVPYLKEAFEFCKENDIDFRIPGRCGIPICFIEEYKQHHDEMDDRFHDTKDKVKDKRCVGCKYVHCSGMWEKL